MSTVRLVVSADVAAVKDTVVVAKPSATFLELKQQIVTGCGLAAALATVPAAKSIAKSVCEEKTALNGFGLLAVAQGILPRDITNEKETASVKDLGLNDGTTIVLCAPAAMKPKKVRKGHTKGDDEDSKDKPKKKGDERSIEDYKGLTPKNVIQKYLTAEDKTKKKKLAFEFIEMNASEILKSKQFAELKREVVTEILKSDKLAVDKEVEVLDGVMAWGKAELKRNPPKSTDSKADVKTVLGDLLHLVRFPCMELNDIALKVSTTNLLDQAQTLALFTYLGQKAALVSKSDNKKASIPLDASIKMFSQKQREGLLIGKQIWDSNKKDYALTIDNDNETVRVTSGGSWMSVLGKYPLKEMGRKTVYWTITIQSLAGTGCVGIARNNVAMRPGSYGCDHNSWIYYGNGNKATGASPSTYGTSMAYTRGSVIGVLCDLEKETLSFFNNGTAQGVAFTVTGLKDCFPFMALNSNGDVWKADWKAKPPK